MSAARHIVGMLKSHIEGDDDEFLSVALQAAAHEARQGHGTLAQEMRALIERARRQGNSSAAPQTKYSLPHPALEPNTGVAHLLSVQMPETRLSEMILDEDLRGRLERIVREQRERDVLVAHGLSPRRKILLVGPPGSGKTLTARALAGELKMPLMSVLLEGVITKFMGETAVKLKAVFDTMQNFPGVYFFDEFDAIGAKRGADNDVGEIRRVLNSFLQFLENDRSSSLIVAATNHPEMLDRALFRRFDDVLTYQLPTFSMVEKLLRAKLIRFKTTKVNWAEIAVAAGGLSQAEVVSITQEAAKVAVLEGRKSIGTEDLMSVLAERQASNFSGEKINYP